LRHSDKGIPVSLMTASSAPRSRLPTIFVPAPGAVECWAAPNPG
jgi:hypothetical protein